MLTARKQHVILAAFIHFIHIAYGNDAIITDTGEI